MSKGFSPTTLVTNAVLSSTSPPCPPIFSLLVASTRFFRLWTHKWWNWLLAQEQDGEVGTGGAVSHRSATAKTGAFSIQGKSHCQQQFPPFWWWRILSPLLAMGHLRRWNGGARVEARLIFAIAFLFYHFLPDFFSPTPITCRAHKVNATSLNCC